jgi:outer membrane protein OmpA-like peptidoglycan-associated protein
MMAARTRYICLAFCVAALSACTTKPGESVVGATHGNPGKRIDGPPLGAAVTNNAQIMTGEKQFRVDLAKRFARDVPTMVNFAFDSARLSATARGILDRQAHWIRQFPEVRFRVYGHTDAVGSDAYNQRLGRRRAHAVVNYLVRHGISRGRLEALVSHGETRPLVVTQGRERRNRRTVTEVSGFLQNHPVIMDGKYAEVVYREYVASAAPATTLSTVDAGETVTGGE